MVFTWGGDLDKVWPTLILATTAAAMGMETIVFFTFWGLFPLVRNDVHVTGDLRVPLLWKRGAAVHDESGLPTIERIAMRVFASPADLHAAVGEHLGYSQWHAVDQAQVTRFADATGDHQWIHVDPERAEAGPFGTTIAHGFLVLSLVPMLASEVYSVDGVRMGINYGLNRVRFTAPVPTGSKLRAGVRLLSVEDVAGGVHVVNQVTVELEGSDKPCCVAETVARLYR